jgi:hypothetical protein
MTTAPSTGTRRSLQEDLLDDLRLGPVRPATAPVTAHSLSPLREPGPAAVSELPTPALELRITPRSWASAGWTRRSGGDGLAISLGPLCLSVGRLRT